MFWVGSWCLPLVEAFVLGGMHVPGAVFEEQPGLKEAVSLSAGWTETIAV